MRFLYSTILYLLTPLLLLRLVWRGLKNRGYWSRWPERFGYLPVPPRDRETIWIHAVSVGEVQAATPLIMRLSAQLPQYQILITTVTPTGAALVEQKLGDSVRHHYLPYDLPAVIRRFLDTIEPLILIVMETELWPNLYRHCHNRQIPIMLANARISARSYRGYKKLSGLAHEVLNQISVIAAQSREDAERFLSLGAGSDIVCVMGNMKFDVNIPHSTTEEAQVLRRYFSVNRPIWIAASTHEGEEKLILQAHREILKRHGSSLLIIAPRHPERFVKVAELCARSGFHTVSKSDGGVCTAHVQVFVLDTLGELLLYYAVADVAFVGGSLLPFGGHNVLEPASVGVPVLTGRYTHNFLEINRLLLEKGAEYTVQDPNQLAEKVALLFGDGNLRHRMGQVGKEMIDLNKGATERLMQMIVGTLPIK